VDAYLKGEQLTLLEKNNATKKEEALHSEES
jgi:hypothetical protein